MYLSMIDSIIRVERSQISQFDVHTEPHHRRKEKLKTFRETTKAGCLISQVLDTPMISIKSEQQQNN